MQMLSYAAVRQLINATRALRLPPPRRPGASRFEGTRAASGSVQSGELEPFRRGERDGGTDAERSSPQRQS